MVGVTLGCGNTNYNCQCSGKTRKLTTLSAGGRSYTIDHQIQEVGRMVEFHFNQDEFHSTTTPSIRQSFPITPPPTRKETPGDNYPLLKKLGNQEQGGALVDGRTMYTFSTKREHIYCIKYLHPVARPKSPSICQRHRSLNQSFFIILNTFVFLFIRYGRMKNVV